jgi:hypothetical protein
LGVYPATLDEIEERFATNPGRRDLMECLRRAVRTLRTAGGFQRIFVVGCFIGPRDMTGDVDLLATFDPAVALEDRASETLAARLEVLRKSLKPEVDLNVIDDDLPTVDEAIRFFQRDKAEHGGFDRGILQLVW